MNRQFETENKHYLVCQPKTPSRVAACCESPSLTDNLADSLCGCLFEKCWSNGLFLDLRKIRNAQMKGCKYHKHLTQKGFNVFLTHLVGSFVSRGNTHLLVCCKSPVIMACEHHAPLSLRINVKETWERKQFNSFSAVIVQIAKWKRLFRRLDCQLLFHNYLAVIMCRQVMNLRRASAMETCLGP